MGVGSNVQILKLSESFCMKLSEIIKKRRSVNCDLTRKWNSLEHRDPGPSWRQAAVLTTDLQSHLYKMFYVILVVKQPVPSVAQSVNSLFN